MSPANDNLIRARAGLAEFTVFSSSFGVAVKSLFESASSLSHCDEGPHSCEQCSFARLVYLRRTHDLADVVLGRVAAVDGSELGFWSGIGFSEDYLAGSPELQRAMLPLLINMRDWLRETWGLLDIIFLETADPEHLDDDQGSFGRHLPRVLDSMASVGLARRALTIMIEEIGGDEESADGTSGQTGGKSETPLLVADRFNGYVRFAIGRLVAKASDYSIARDRGFEPTEPEIEDLGLYVAVARFERAFAELRLSSGSSWRAEAEDGVVRLVNSQPNITEEYVPVFIGDLYVRATRSIGGRFHKIVEVLELLSEFEEREAGQVTISDELDHVNRQTIALGKELVQENLGEILRFLNLYAVLRYELARFAEITGVKTSELTAFSDDHNASALDSCYGEALAAVQEFLKWFRAEAHEVGERVWDRLGNDLDKMVEGKESYARGEDQQRLAQLVVSHGEAVARTVAIVRAQRVLSPDKRDGLDQSSKRPSRDSESQCSSQPRPEFMQDKEYLANMENLTSKLTRLIGIFYDTGPEDFGILAQWEFGHVIRLIGLLHSSHATVQESQ